MASGERAGPLARAGNPDEEQQRVLCSHCGLEVPRGLIEPGATEQFCCGGCRAVYGMLNDLGLERYYQLADEAEPRPARTPTRRSYEELDDPTFTERSTRLLADGSRQVELYLEGVHCAACVWLVERLPALLAGVREVRLHFGRGVADVSWDPQATALSAIARLLDALGYPVHPARGRDLRQVRRQEDRRFLIRLAVAGAVAGNVMLIAFALYGGLFSGMAAAHRSLFHWVSLLLTVPSLFWAGALFFRGAIGGLRGRTLHMDLPIALGLAAGFALSAINTVRGRGDVYFDSITVLVFLLLVGRWLQRRQQRAAFEAAEQLFALTPSTARLLDDDDRAREVPLEALRAGARVEVLAGDSVPADGRVLAGRSAVDTALLTGEPTPRPVGPGELVHAGTVNLAARLTLEVEATGEETRVGRLMQLIEETARRRAPVVQLADRIAGWFVAATLALAALTIGIWLARAPGEALQHGMALLIVCCPCALALATPLAVSAAIGRAVGRGILIKGGDVVERLARPGLVLLDKTGTLTVGRTALVAWEGDEALRGQVRALEAHSGHHLARALRAGAQERGPGEADDHAVDEVREELGAGIEGRVDGRLLRIGAPEWIARRGARPASWSARFVDEARRAGQTPVLVAADGEVAAAAAFDDALREDAAPTLQRLRRRGWQLGILSGDDAEVVARKAATLGLDPARCRGGLTPEQKLQAVKEAARRQPVVMVGDGVNDAAALAAATVGIAVHGGAEASLAAADVFIGRPGLAPVAELFAGARATLRVIHRNLAFSLVYNLIGASLALVGLLNPLYAAVLMPLSSLTVVTSSYRSRTFVPAGRPRGASTAEEGR